MTILMERANGNERTQPPRTRDDIIAQPPQFNGNQSRSGNWARAFARFGSIHEFEIALRCGDFVRVREGVDVDTVNSVDNLISRWFSAAQIRLSKDMGNLSSLTCSDAAHLILDSDDSSSSAFAALQEFYIRETCALATIFTDELVQARLKEFQSLLELEQWVLRKRNIVSHNGLDRVADR